MEPDLAWIALAIVATGCALYTLRVALLIRRAEGESWPSVYLRVYWNPGCAVVIAAYAWSVVFGGGLFSEKPTPLIFGAAVGMLALVTAAAARNQRDGFGGGQR